MAIQLTEIEVNNLYHLVKNIKLSENLKELGAIDFTEYKIKNSHDPTLKKELITNLETIKNKYHNILSNYNTGYQPNIDFISNNYQLLSHNDIYIGNIIYNKIKDQNKLKAILIVDFSDRHSKLYNNLYILDHNLDQDSYQENTLYLSI